MKIRILKNERELKILELELEHISPKFITSQNITNIYNIKDFERFYQELIEKRDEIEEDIGEIIVISSLNKESMEISTKIFLDELINALNKIIEIYGDQDVRIIIE